MGSGVEAASPGKRQDRMVAWVKLEEPTGFADGLDMGEQRRENSSV